MRNLRTWCLLVVSALLIPACGSGTDPLPINVPVAVVGTPAGTVAGNVTINYTLTDVEPEACVIVAEYSVNGGVSFAAATGGVGGEGLTGLASTPGGSAHTFVWNSLADGVATAAANAAVRFRITPTNSSAGTAGQTTSFTVDNSANTAPSVAVTTPGVSQSGNVTISYTLTDAENHQTSIVVEFSANGGASFSPALAGPGGDGVSGLAAASGGTAHTFVWNSLADGVGTGAPNATVRIRITATDSATGVPGSSANFTVNNSGNTAPSASIITPGASSGVVGFNYTLTDAESSTCSILVEFSTNGGGTFAPASQAPGGDPMTTLISSPGGTAHVFVWNSFQDGVATGAANTTVRFRITPSDVLAGSAGTTANFTVDNTGNSSGSSVGTPFNLNVGYRATAAASDGNFLFVGGHNHIQWRLAKLDFIGGAPVWTRDSDPDGGDDRIMDLKIDGTHVYTLGVQEVAPFTGSIERKWRIEKRLMATGDLVSAFGSGGAVVTANLGDSPVVSMAIDATSMYVTGVVENPPLSGTYDLRLEKRSLTDGSVITTFGTNGVVTGGGGLSVAHDGTHLYCVASQDLVADGKLRVEKRKMIDGTLENGFGTNGVIVTNVNAIVGAFEVATSVAVDATSLYIYENVETGAATGTFPWRITKRDRATGTTSVLTVSGSGTALMGPGGGFVAVDGSSLYVAGRDHAAANDGQWRFEKRRTSDLGLDTTFNGTGIVSFNPTVSGDEEFANCLLVTRGLLVVVGEDNGVVRRWRIEGRFK